MSKNKLNLIEELCNKHCEACKEYDEVHYQENCFNCTYEKIFKIIRSDEKNKLDELTEVSQELGLYEDVN